MSRQNVFFILLTIAVLTVGFRAFTLDPVRISAKQTCDAYEQGALLGSQTLAEQLGQMLEKNGQINLGNGKVLVPQESKEEKKPATPEKPKE